MFEVEPRWLHWNAKVRGIGVLQRARLRRERCRCGLQFCALADLQIVVLLLPAQFKRRFAFSLGLVEQGLALRADCGAGAVLPCLPKPDSDRSG